MEDAIREPDISKSVQRFQLAIAEAKVRLDLAVSPRTWLMPSNLVINTQSTVGYNNSLKKANAEMKLGVNSVNSDMKKVGVKLMNEGPSKINRPNSHPSNPFQQNSSAREKRSSNDSENKILKDSYNHEILKAGVFTAAAVSAFVIYRFL
jgi:hypothetical protein